MGFRVKKSKVKEVKAGKGCIFQKYKNGNLQQKGQRLNDKWVDLGLWTKVCVQSKPLNTPAFTEALEQKAAVAFMADASAKAGRRGHKVTSAAFETCEADPWMCNGGRTRKSLDQEAHPPLSHREEELMVLKQQGPQEKHIE